MKIDGWWHLFDVGIISHNAIDDHSTVPRQTAITACLLIVLLSIALLAPAAV